MSRLLARTNAHTRAKGLNIQQVGEWNSVIVEEGGKHRRCWKKAKGGKRQGKYRTRMVGGEVAEDLFNRGLCLPSGTAMTDSDLDRIISTIRRSHK
jgi:dTDP-4-amino-4,6-dideoxygalactose transaminase